MSQGRAGSTIRRNKSGDRMRVLEYDANPAVAEALRLAESAWEAGDNQDVVREESTIYGYTRRIVDLIVVLGVFPFALIGISVIAIVVKLDSPGPAIFKQKRVGQYGKIFTFYKFRTMWIDARERYPEMYAYSYTPEEIQNLRFKEGCLRRRSSEGPRGTARISTSTKMAA